jgi:predicted nuclease of predicted toxin-antitoxin system
MLFIADANVFVPMVEGLRHMGHDAFDVKERGLENLSDPDLFQLSQNQRRILITMDKDFSSILLYPPGEHYGIIVVKLYRLKVAEATKLFIDAINDIKPEDISGNLVIIDRGKTRIRKEKLED